MTLAETRELTALPKEPREKIEEALAVTGRTLAAVTEDEIAREQEDSMRPGTRLVTLPRKEFWLAETINNLTRTFSRFHRYWRLTSLGKTIKAQNRAHTTPTSAASTDITKS